MGLVRTIARLGLAVAVATALGAAFWGEAGYAASATSLSGPDAGVAAGSAPDGAATGGASSPDVPGGLPQAGATDGGSGPKVGLQAGHWLAAEAPPPYNTQPGSSGRGKTEAEVNLAIAEAVARYLRAVGYAVEILPTAIPQGYQADVVVAIHADGGPGDRRGFFVDHSSRPFTAAAESRLAQALTDAYAAVGIPNVYRGTVNSQRYYGYYSVDSQTPMALIETGFLTSALDQRVLIDASDRAGAAIAQGIVDFLGAPASTGGTETAPGRPGLR